MKGDATDAYGRGDLGYLDLLMGLAGGMVQIEFSDVSMEKLGQKAGGTVTI